MNNFILCSSCGALVAYNSYFSGYECSNCGAFTPIKKEDCENDEQKNNIVKNNFND